MLNVTNIPAPRVSIIDERTGLISREWYRFFLNLFTLVGQGDNETNLNDLQFGPPAQNINILVSGGLTDLAPPPVPPVSTADTQAILPPSIQFSPDNSQALLPSVAFPSADDSQALLPSVVQAIVQSYADLAPPIIPPSIATNGTVTSVNVSGGTTGMSFTGGPITTSGTITMSGTLGTANGGTGAASLTGAGIVTTTDTQTISGVKTFSSTSNAFVGATYKTSNAYFYEDTSYAVLGGVNGVTLGYGSHPGTGGFVLDNTGIRPFTDNTYRNGNASWRWTEIFAVTGTINTSDESQKQQVRELLDAEQLVAQRVKKLIRAFKWNDAVEAKGEDARIHFGVIAQDVQEAFAAEGLDASKYGLFCSDTWTNSDGSSQTRLGVRYSELLAFVIAAL